MASCNLMKFNLNIKSLWICNFALDFQFILEVEHKFGSWSRNCSNPCWTPNQYQSDVGHQSQLEVAHVMDMRRALTNNNNIWFPDINRWIMSTSRWSSTCPPLSSRCRCNPTAPRHLGYRGCQSPSLRAGLASWIRAPEGPDLVVARQAL